MSYSVIPIYSSRGDPDAFLVFPYLFNRSGEWIGFVTPQKDVYSVLGIYVGALTNDPRIIRRRSTENKPNLTPPDAPAHVRIPATVPLARMMSELTPGLIDILQDEPDRLHTLDAGELRPDLD